MLSKRRIERRVEPTLRFLGEQDGNVEQQLKRELTFILSKTDMQRAYLARVDFGEGTKAGVALCLRGTDDKSLVADVAALFRRSFGVDQQLDICFISVAQEQRLKKVCRDFYAIA